MPKVRQVMSIGFCSKFHTLSSTAKFWKSVKIWQSYRELKGGNFLRHSVDSKVADPSRNVYQMLEHMANLINSPETMTDPSSKFYCTVLMHLLQIHRWQLFIYLIYLLWYARLCMLLKLFIIHSILHWSFDNLTVNAYFNSSCLLYIFTSNVTSVTEVPSASTRLFAGTWRPWWVLLQHSYYVVIIFHRRVSHAFSALCMYSKFGHHPHPLGYLCAKFCFFGRLHC